MTSSLTTQDHNRNIAGLKYIYPVLSRRAGGLSIGVNLNTNNACNWRCIYCQVPDLVKGSAPAIDLDLLAYELRFFLDLVLSGEFYRQFNVDSKHRVIKDIAISGNGEPTSAKAFERVTRLIGEIAREKSLLPAIKLVLITNGSLMHRTEVQQGLKNWQDFGGEVWFKLDSATEQGRRRINNTELSDQRVLKNIVTSAKLCKTRIQTCLLDDRGQGFNAGEHQAYVDLMATIIEKTNIREVMLYSLARTSYQPESGEIAPLSPALMEKFSEKIRALGMTVTISV